ncbi:MAG: hypothetical protein KKB76_03610, partial [Candidatus Omnitrophica bacterium]|nr:hypothetical protein [Candidatus Omnitrophota bacterium]
MQKVVIFLVGGLILSSSVTILARPARGSRKSSQERQPVDRSEPTVDTKKKTSLTELEMSDTQKENINKLKTDLMNIKEGSEVTEAQKEAFKNDLLAIADGATRPDPALTEQLVND